MEDLKPNLHFDNLYYIHEYIGLEKPKNNLFTVVELEKVKLFKNKNYYNVSTDYYIITLKEGNNWDLKYGMNNFEFGDFGVSFIAPRQIVSIIDFEQKITKGYSILFHSAFLKNHALYNKISSYEFFSYKYNKAANISNEERELIKSFFNSIFYEHKKERNKLSRDIILSNIELILLYASRIYNTQTNDLYTKDYDILINLEEILNNFFNTKQNKLPTVGFLANQLNLTPSYLSNLLKKRTGCSAQQMIHKKAIEKAKSLLATTQMSISEIAFDLGFEYSQSFSKLFKKKTNVSPLEYRKLYQTGI